MILYKCDGHAFSGGRKCANEIKHDEPSFWLTISGSIKNGLHDSHVIEANGAMHFCSKNCLLAYLFKDNPIGEKKFYNELGEWAKAAFPDAGPAEHLKKLIAEANETIEAPNNTEEYADCLMCLFAAAYKAGISIDNLVAAVHKKFVEVQKRKWEKLPDGTYQHINPSPAEDKE